MSGAAHALIAAAKRRLEDRTARELIEARIGRRLPPARDMAVDERQAVKRLAQQLLKEKQR